MCVEKLVSTFVSRVRSRLCTSLSIGKSVEENVLIRQLMLLFLLKFDVIERESAPLPTDLITPGPSSKSGTDHIQFMINTLKDKNQSSRRRAVAVQYLLGVQE